MVNSDIERVKNILERAKQLAWSDSNTYKVYGGNGYQDVINVVDKLSAVCNATCTAKNPDFKNIPTTTAKMICLWEDYPESYAALMMGMNEDAESHRLDTLSGLILLQNFINGMSDDGEYGLDCSGLHETFRPRHKCPAGSQSIYPASLLEILVKLSEQKLQDRPESVVNAATDDHNFWFSSGFDEAVKEMILKNQFSDATLSCQNESHRWAKKLIEADPDIDVQLNDGFYFPHGDIDRAEGHSWLEVNGYIFDPTALQFEGEIEVENYQTHECFDGDELKQKLFRRKFTS